MMILSLLFALDWTVDVAVISSCFTVPNGCNDDQGKEEKADQWSQNTSD